MVRTPARDLEGREMKTPGTLQIPADKNDRAW
jgi:hypothetical protein